jgi:hypothetical protein
VAKLAIATGHAMQIFNDLYYSNLQKCIAGLLAYSMISWHGYSFATGLG